MEGLCCRYWYPLYSWLRRRGNSHDKAEDLTQGFFVHLLDQERLQRADATRGRFRTFLLTSLQNFARAEHRRETTQRRGGDHVLLPLDFSGADARYRNEPIDDLTPERLFDRAWAMTMLEQAMAALRSDYNAGGKGELFEALQPGLVDHRPEFQAEAAARLQMSLGSIRVALHRLRQRYREKLRSLVQQTVDSQGDVDEELAALFQAIE